MAINAHLMMGEVAEAARAGKQARAAFREARDHRGEAGVLEVLVQIHITESELNEALDALNGMARALEASRWDHRRSLCRRQRHSQPATCNTKSCSMMRTSFMKHCLGIMSKSRRVTRYKTKSHCMMRSSFMKCLRIMGRSRRVTRGNRKPKPKPKPKHHWQIPSSFQQKHCMRTSKQQRVSRAKPERHCQKLLIGLQMVL